MSLAPILDFQRMFHAKPHTIFNALKAGIVAPERVAPGHRGKQRMLNRLQATELALALGVYKLGIEAFAVRVTVERHLADVMAGKVDLIVIGADQTRSAAVGGGAEFAAHLAAEQTLRVVNCSRIRQLVNEMFRRPSVGGMTLPLTQEHEATLAEFEHNNANPVPRRAS